MSTISFTIKWGKETLDLKVPATTTVGQLRVILQERTRVPPAMQKLMFKGQMKDDAKTLQELGVKDGSKLMLIGSTVEDVVTVNTSPEVNQQPEQRRRQQAMWADPVWRSAPYAALLADPFLEGSGLPASHMVEGMRLLGRLLGRVNRLQALAPTLEPKPHRLLSTFALPDYQTLAEGQRLLKACLDFTEAAAQAVKPDEIQQVVEEWTARVAALDVGRVLLAPGGWLGMAQAGTVLHIIERVSATKFAFVTCNSGSGLEYHPSRPTTSANSAPKLRYRTALRIEDVPAERMADKGFWALLLSQWMKPNDPNLMSEYNRVEVLYDVLLPWLAEAPASHPGSTRLLSQALLDTEGDPRTDWRSPSRSSSSSTRSLLEGLRYVYRHLGLAPAQLKQLHYVLRWELLQQTGEDLLLRAQRHERALPGVAAAIRRCTEVGLAVPEAPTLAPFKAEVQRAGEEHLRTASGKRVGVDALDRLVVGLYFAADWCKVCKQFGPILAECYQKIKARGQQFEIVCVSADQSADVWRRYSSDMPWLLAPYPGATFLELYGVQKLPTLLLFDGDGRLMTGDGVAAVLQDPSGTRFPATPWDGAEPLSAADAKLLALGSRQVAHAAVKENERGRLPGLQEVTAVVDALDALAEALPQSAAPPVLPPALAMGPALPAAPFPHFGLLRHRNVDAFLGAASAAQMPALANLNSIPRVVRTADQAMAAIVKCHQLCSELFARAKDAGTSSRLALQWEVIALVGAVFTELLPMPRPPNLPADHPDAQGCIWRRGFLNDPVGSAEVCLTHVYRLLVAFTTAWQAVEEPPRAADSERGLVAACLLAVFDVVVRMNPETSILASLLAADGGYAFSTGVCQNTRPFAQVSATMELVNPRALAARAGVLAYLEGRQALARHQLFDFRMPDKIEIRKYSDTCRFLRDFLGRCGYELTTRGQATSEMEALMNWFTDPHTPLAREHPEFAMARDAVLLFKFLTTMESREAELLRRRKDLGEYHTWRLSFEEGGAGQRFTAQWRTNPMPPRWECVGVRGRDLDIADLQVVGFGDRELRFGEGPVVQSPAALPRLIGVQHPTEDDVLHAEHLPTFGGVLSVEEAEQLLCFLTVDYLRIPLVLHFFAGQDRAIYLFNGQLQALLRAVLFEPGTFVTECRAVEFVPMRMTALQKREQVIERLVRANAQEDDSLLLGTAHGLLLNELCCSPDAVLEPLLQIVRAVQDLTKSSVYSSNASFILYMVALAIDVETFVVRAIELGEEGAWDPRRGSAENIEKLRKWRPALHEYLHGLIAPTLEQWRKEAEAVNDMPTASVIHAYLALLWTNVSPAALTPAAVAAVLGSVAFVRARHGFGLGMLRSQMLEQEGEDELTPEARLVRFLQAQGIDTRNIQKDSLDRGRNFMTAGGRRRALFLHISSRMYHDTIRVPTLLRQKAGSDGGTSAIEAKAEDGGGILRVPPADVPEGALFALLQRHRAMLVAWFEVAGPEVRDAVLHQVVQVVLRGQNPAREPWQPLGNGQFVAGRSELKFDVQGAELFWRNDELRPVPDSMTHFADFETILGREALQCGLVQRTQRRHWVHIVGTEYDLVEWDEPDPVNQGVGLPAKPSLLSGEVCRLCGRRGQCWVCSCTVSNCGMALAPAGTPCPLCGTAKPGAGRSASHPDEDLEFEGVRYNRPVNAYDEYHPHETERWVMAILRPVLRTAYPEEGEMKWTLLLPQSVLPADATVARLVGVDAKQHEKQPEQATWKEVVVFREHSCLHVYNLVSHGRRTFRSLVYTSDAQYCLHSMAPILSRRQPKFLSIIRRHAGDLKRRREHDSSLVILRHSQGAVGKEVFLPPRLLQGLIPSVLLEAFHFWEGEDGVVRGEPVDADASAFQYRLEIAPDPFQAQIRRRPWQPRPAAHRDRPGPLQREAAAAPAATTGQPMEGTEEGPPEEQILQLMEFMGGNASLKVCRLALQRNANNLELAFQWLCDDATRPERLLCDAEVEDDVPMAVAEAEVAAAFPMPTSLGLDRDESMRSAPNSHEVPEESEVELLLLNVLDAPSALGHRLATLLARLEDLSHVLVWGTPGGAAPAGGEVAVGLVELPRLRARFEPQRGEDGRVRLFLADHPGWFVSDAFAETEGDIATPPGATHLQQLLSGLDQFLLLENPAHELMLMLPNHDCYRPEVIRDPFAAELVYDRASLGWQEVVGTPFYLYPVHPSRTFLLPPSLSATLYLALLRFMKFDHVAAAGLIEACSVDTKFTAEEQWVFSQFARTLTSDVPDNHPDAHACRLRLNLAVLYSENKAGWEMHRELDRYLAKWAHVSAECRLSPEEELDLLVRTEKATPAIRNRLAQLKALAAGDGEVVQHPAPVQAGGDPWLRLCLLRQNFLYSQGTSLQRLQYNPPGDRLDTTKTLELLWKDELVADDESGSNRQLGFLFLYQLLKGAVGLSIGSTDCTQSLAQLLCRYFHLKLARWGKEVVEQGEGEHVVSRQVAALAAVAALPALPWPAARFPDFHAYQLKRGINLGSPEARDGPVKEFIDTLDAQFRNALRGPLQMVHHELTRAVEAIKARQLSAPLTLPLGPVQPAAGGRAEPSDTSCAQLVIAPFHFACVGTTELAVSQEDVDAFASTPFQVLDLAQFLTWEEAHGAAEKVASTLPFNIRSHPAAATEVAQDMLQRMEGDMGTFANMVNQARVPVLRHLARADIGRYAAGQPRPGLPEAIANLQCLCRSLDGLQQRDAAFMEKAIQEAEIIANTATTDAATVADVAFQKFLLRRTSRQFPRVTMAWLTAVLLSSQFEGDVGRANPFVRHVPELRQLVAVALLHVSRYHHANQAIAQAQALIAALQQLDRENAAVPHETDVKATAERVHQLTSALGEAVAVRRYFMAAVGDGRYTLDPRFLLVEYMFSILLRQRQVEMVEWFVANVRAGSSRVQQMIMGAGKTTVLGPLLALILADGAALVTQVMPTALLEQSRNILRRCFSVLVPKQVYTLQFDRGVEDSAALITQLHAKLTNACRRRAIVCASPEAIKSLTLKFVEQLHAIEKLQPGDLVPVASVRANKEIKYLRDKMLARSEMADALVKILDLWHRGVLIMDEVDVLLHPLRSELNFPIGHKVPIDLSHLRWNLPIHLIDAVFYGERRFVCEPLSTWEEEGKAIGCPASDILRDLAAAIQRGLTIHALQREPHLVLLDPQFYATDLKPLLARWMLLWLFKTFGGPPAVHPTVLLKYITGDQRDVEECRAEIEARLMPEAKKLLNLTHSWLGTLLPHVLAKIDRVSFGLLSPSDLLLVDPKCPQTRKLMAVPFVGKDVPSASSEFAHPDVLIGLTILAYRYEGLRKTDLHRVVVQLKQDYSRQAGPRDRRPAAQLFQTFLTLARTRRPNGDCEDPDILPLSLFQPNDQKQLAKLFQLVRKLPELVHHLLCQHVFPVTMNFQQLKVSAAGHELGSNILFGARIGFSGTPSNLLPMDLGGFQYDAEGRVLGCQYEPGSDGKIVHVLTNPAVTTARVLPDDWSPHSILRDIAQSPTPVHALIDTGAFVTNMDNEEVAQFLLRHLPPAFEGVVYLDRQDRQMILLRSTFQSVPLSQCGLSPARRFTFYDQIHTTGMDIKQAPTAAAVVTIGKDMTFRDYAQGAFRMRGIGRGQTIQLFVIPEVQHRIEQQLGRGQPGSTALYTGRQELDVPAWLLLNSMRMEGLQFFKLCSQELHNVWRKKALAMLEGEVHQNATQQSPAARLSRFNAPQPYRYCVEAFREPIGFPVPDHVPTPEPYTEKLQAVVGQNTLLLDEGDAGRVQAVLARLRRVAESHGGEAERLGLNQEVVHEQEQEEEQEEEAEEEEQRINVATRDDEQHVPWSATVLTTAPSGVLGDSPFYRLAEFQVRDEQPRLAFPPHVWLSDNFFKTRWRGLGDRRLKIAAIVLEWVVPEAAPSQTGPQRLVVALSLAESETLRWMLHTNQSAVAGVGMALRTVSGSVLDRSPGYDSPDGPTVPTALLCFRFFNGEMFYSDAELAQLEAGLQTAPLATRKKFFEECLRLRRRQRNVWEDTPLAKLFTPQAEWHTLRAHAQLVLMREALQRRIAGGRADPVAAFLKEDVEGRGSVTFETFQRVLQTLHLGFAPGDYAEVCPAVDPANPNAISLEAFMAAFRIPAILPAPEATTPAGPVRSWTCQQCTCRNPEDAPSCEACGMAKGSATWQCAQCTCINPGSVLTCEACGFGNNGAVEVPPGHWVCAAESGGCTRFNLNSLYYCESCDRARPDLPCHRF